MLTIKAGLTFAMDGPRWDLVRRQHLWVVHELRGMMVLIAPMDVCCIPPQVTRASLERAIEAGEARPCSIIG